MSVNYRVLWNIMLKRLYDMEGQCRDMADNPLTPREEKGTHANRALIYRSVAEAMRDLADDAHREAEE
jgi:hypothetical protein